ncbi:CxC2 domain-containing protein [Mycena kentingensis (nom. inval.)]|nr:CxC2 domain-containing protein [Mycena kentingensis (nom. inval.)]
MGTYSNTSSSVSSSTYPSKTPAPNANPSPAARRRTIHAVSPLHIGPIHKVHLYANRLLPAWTRPASTSTLLTMDDDEAAQSPSLSEPTAALLNDAEVRGTTDLIRGEAYQAPANAFRADWMRDWTRNPCLVSYDIACQWAWLHRRALTARARLQPDIGLAFQPDIPRWFADVHADDNVPTINFRPALGRTDGEHVERTWMEMVLDMAPSTREMPQGRRDDTIDDTIDYTHQGWQPALAVALQIAEVDLLQQRAAAIALALHEPKARLVNTEAAAHSYAPRTEVLDVFGSWSPMVPGEDWEDCAQEVVEIQIEAVPEKRRRYVSSDDPMRLWRARAGLYLDDIMRTEEGLGRYFQRPSCTECGARDVQIYRCRDCGLYLQCEDCLRDAHTRRPLHCPETWNGDFWTPCWLFSNATVDDASKQYLGMVYQLGHHGLACVNPEALKGKGQRKKMVVLDIGGIFEIDIQYCACGDRLLHRHGHVSQLLGNGWYPATTIEPSTCATFRLLEYFRRLKVGSNVNANDFVRTLERLTNATATRKVPERYKSFIRMARQWDYLKRSKRAGRANYEDGLRTTEPGGLAVWCWACPDPKRNLPQGWESVDKKFAYLYKLMLALDANFRLKNRLRANERQDPSLGPGLGYFVLLEAYKEWLRRYVAEEDVSTCIAFQALMQKETRLTTGLRVSGVGGCVCAHHGLVRPLGIGDLQKGERYANMDWILHSAVNASGVKQMLLSYDIACQWKQRLLLRGAALLAGEEERVRELEGERVRELEETQPVAANFLESTEVGQGDAGNNRKDVNETAKPAIRTDLKSYELQFGLPVWQAAVHEETCREEMSLSHAVGVGRTDGEGIERTWAVLNPVGYSTKEMGEGHRHDTIEDKIDNINFLKNIGEGDTLARKLIIALAERDRQVAEFKEVDASLDPDMREEWQHRVDKWNTDRSKPNPYLQDGRHETPTEAKILAELKKAELEQVRSGNRSALRGKVTAVAFIKAGLQLEDMQRRIRAEVKATVTMSAERASQIDELRVSFWKKLRKWQNQQNTFMPGVEELRAREEELRNSDVAPPLAEHTKLRLPSGIPAAARQDICAGSGVAALEARLREGQCSDALDGVRGHLQSRHHIIDYRNANVVGQMASTRSNTLVSRIDGQKMREVFKYREAYVAGHALDGDAFLPEMQELRDEDVRLGIVAEEDEWARAELNRVGTSKRVRSKPMAQRKKVQTLQPLSWIWTVGKQDASAVHDAVRVQWTKALARRDHWVEEVELLKEEMRRVLRSLKTVQDEWERRIDGRSGADGELAAAAAAYAKRQKTLYGSISSQFQARWGLSAADAVRMVVAEEEDEDEEDEEDEEVEPMDGGESSEGDGYTSAGSNQMEE